MFTLEEIIKYNIKNKLKPFAKLKTYGLLNREFDNGKDELSELEMNEINNELKQRWLK